MRGYLIAITNEKFSGIAIANFANDREAVRNPQPDTVTRVPIEAGSGVRALVGMFQSVGLYPIPVGEDSPELEYELDELGLLHTIRFVAE